MGSSGIAVCAEGDFRPICPCIRGRAGQRVAGLIAARVRRVVTDSRRAFELVFVCDLRVCALTIANGGVQRCGNGQRSLVLRQRAAVRVTRRRDGRTVCGVGEAVRVRRRFHNHVLIYISFVIILSVNFIQLLRCNLCRRIGAVPAIDLETVINGQ